MRSRSSFPYRPTVGGYALFDPAVSCPPGLYRHVEYPEEGVSGNGHLARCTLVVGWGGDDLDHVVLQASLADCG